MTQEDLKLHSELVNKLKTKIDSMAYDMNDDRNDGWVKEHYRKSLKELRDHINKVLEK